MYKLTSFSVIIATYQKRAAAEKMVNSISNRCCPCGCGSLAPATVKMFVRVQGNKISYILSAPDRDFALIEHAYTEISKAEKARKAAVARMKV